MYGTAIVTFVLLVLGVVVTLWPPNSWCGKAVWVVVLTAVGVIALVLAVNEADQPKVDIANTDALDPSDPFSTPFIVSNNGRATITDVEFSCYIDGLEYEDGAGFTRLALVTQPTIARIDPGDRKSGLCGSVRMHTSPVKGADIQMTIKFKAPRWGLFTKEHERKLRWVTAKQSDGTLRWIPPVK